MKKTTIALSITALIALILGIALFVTEALINPGVYYLNAFLVDSWAQVYLWFSFLTNASWDMLRIIMLSAIAIFGLILPIIWIVMIAKYRKPKSFVVVILWYLILAVAVFDIAFLLGTPNFLATIMASTGILTMLILWATQAFIALALIVIIIAGIINIAYCINAPTPPKRTYANAGGADERLVLIREEPQPNGPSADEIREVLHDELSTSPVPSPTPAVPQSPVHTVSTQPGISGPLLVQYINTYGPQSPAQPATAQQQAPYPPYPFIHSCPCVRGNFVPCMQTGYCSCMKDGKFPCLEQHKVELEPAKEEPAKEASSASAATPTSTVVSTPAATAVIETAKVEPAKVEEPIDLDKIKGIMHGELSVKPVEVPPAKEEVKPSAPSIVQVGPSLEEIRAVVREEMKVEEKEEPLPPAPIIVAMPSPAPAPVIDKNEPKAATSEEIRTIMLEMVEKLAAAKPEPAPLPPQVVVQKEELDEGKIRRIIAEELSKLIVKPEPVKEEPKVVAVPEPTPVAPAPTPVPTVIVVPFVQPEAPAPVAVPIAPPAPAEKPKIIRIPFQVRMLAAEKDMKMNYNELKSEIMSYGVKSRVSNSGDTFRLHTKTFVKITIAGKSLKLYFALNPNDYEKTTLPVQDAGHKGIYEEIPLVFKVKSELSMRRAKQLVADVMERNSLEQGKVELHNWVKEIKPE